MMRKVFDKILRLLYLTWNIPTIAKGYIIWKYFVLSGQKFKCRAYLKELRRKEK